MTEKIKVLGVYSTVSQEISLYEIADSTRKLSSR